MKVKQINIKHPELGEIKVSASIPYKINETIGDVVEDYCRPNYLFHADIINNEDDTFDIVKLKVIKPVEVNIGWMDNSKGNKNFITVIKNISAGDDIKIYPSAVISVIYKD